MSGSPRDMLQHIAIIGDVHGQDDALEAVLTFLKGVKPLDAILCTGDLPGKMGEGNTTRCCDLLSAGGVQTIRGNHDRWAVELANDDFLVSLSEERGLSQEKLAFLAALPRTREFETPLGAMLLCHGVGTKDMDGIYPGGDDETIVSLLKARRIHGWYRVMVAGHTHERMLRRVGTVLLINPGTLLWNKDPGFLTVDFEACTLTVYHLKPFVNEITEAQTLSLPLPEDEDSGNV